MIIRIHLQKGYKKKNRPLISDLFPRQGSRGKSPKGLEDLRDDGTLRVGDIATWLIFFVYVFLFLVLVIFCVFLFVFGGGRVVRFLFCFVFSFQFCFFGDRLLYKFLFFFGGGGWRDSVFAFVVFVYFRWECGSAFPYVIVLFLVYFRSGAWVLSFE